VFRTYEPTRDRLVAVKLFRLDITPEQAQALADELARASDAGLFHPSIVEPVAAGVERTSAYRAEEYVAAESLDVAIRHYAPASLEQALPFITQLAGAIDFARTAGVGHGGLHLRDIFVTPDEARASGFGIVESLERVGLRAPVRRPYTAPERIAGEAWSTPADVFSLAAITYELLTGRRPSGTGNQIGALSAEKMGSHASAIHAVLARAMDEDPERRFPTALAFAAELEAAAHKPSAQPVAAPVAATPVAAPPAVVAPAPVVAPPSVPPPVATAPPPARDDVEVHRPAAPAPVEQVVSPPDHPVLFAEEAEPAALSDRLRETPAELNVDDTFRAEAQRQPELVERGLETPPYTSVEPHGSSYDSSFSVGVPERSRIAVIPIVFGVLLGIALGIAGGYALANRNRAEPTPAAAVQTAPTPTPPSSTSPPPRSGQAYSEQVIPPAEQRVAGNPRQGPSAGTAPPVPSDAPPAARDASPSVAARPTRGSLRVESTPKNAAVTVNGRWRGRTPLTIDDLAFGTHTVRIVQPGFSVARQVVTLSRAEPSRTVTFQLQRPAPPPPARPSASASAGRAPAGAPAKSRAYSGSLFVASNPTGARVFVDGRAVGTAPLRVPEVPIGSHVIRLELPDHRIWTTSERVSAGQETRVTGSLERIQ
jgi:serine/threonine-protein kinase